MATEYSESVLQDLKDLRAAEGDYGNLMYRIGTHGERGLHPERRKLMTKISKLKQKIKAAGYELAYKSEYPHWYFVSKQKS
jgi:hypothetical protein